jgi:hypothetical protein
MSVPEPPEPPRKLTDGEGDDDFRDLLADRSGGAVVGGLDAHGTRCRPLQSEESTGFSFYRARPERLPGFGGGSAERHGRAAEDLHSFALPLGPPNACAQRELLRDMGRSVFLASTRNSLEPSVEHGALRLAAKHPEPGEVPGARRIARVSESSRAMAVTSLDRSPRPEPA